MKYLYGFILLFILSNAYSQNSIGIKNNLFYFNYSNAVFKSGDSIKLVNDISTGLDYDIDIYYIHQLNKIKLLVQLGYRRVVENRIINFLFDSPKLTNKYAFDNLTLNSYKIAIGMEKKVELKPFQLISGFEIPVEYSPITERIYNTYIYDETKTLIGKRDIILTQPQSFRIGLYFNLKFYHFYKRIGIGLEFLNGIQFDLPGKIISRKLNYYNLDGSLKYSIYNSYTHKRISIKKSSFIAIGIRYKFNERKKNDANKR